MSFRLASVMKSSLWLAPAVILTTNLAVADQLNTTTGQHRHKEMGVQRQATTDPAKPFELSDPIKLDRLNDTRLSRTVYCLANPVAQKCQTRNSDSGDTKIARFIAEPLWAP